MKFAWLILRSLRRNRRRNILTSLSIAISIFMFCGLASVAAIPALLLRGPASSRRLVCQNKAGLFFSLPESYARKIAAMPRVNVVQGWELLPSEFRGSADKFFSYAVDPHDMRELWPEWGISAPAAAAFEHQRTAVLVGPDLAHRHGWRVGQQIVVHGNLPSLDVPVNIVGVMAPGTSSTGALNILVLRRDYLESLKGMPGLVAVFWIQVDRITSIDPVIASIDSAFRDSEYQTRTEAEGEFSKNLFSGLASMFTLATVLGVIVVIVVTLVAANTAAMSIRERGREIAVMRAIGFNPDAVLFWLVSEASLIGIAGGLIGGLATWLVLGDLAPPIPGLNQPLPMSTGIIPTGIVLAWLVGIVSAFAPAWVATCRDIVTGLRWIA